MTLLKTSGIPVPVLREIWMLANTRGGTALNRSEFSLALRAVGAAQAGAVPSLELLMSSVGAPLPAPLFEGIAAFVAAPASSSVATAPAAGSRHGAGASYAIGAADQAKYDAIFSTTDADRDGFISGGEAVALFLKSGLEKSVLKAIWTLSDLDRDQRLDHLEFCVAMHLVVSLSKRGMALPAELPRELVPSAKAHFMAVGGGGGLCAAAAAAAAAKLGPDPDLGPSPSPSPTTDAAGANAGGLQTRQSR